MENNSGYKPIQKKQVVIFLANSEETQKTKGGIYLSDDSVFNKISGMREGILVEITEDCFENFCLKPKIGNTVSFKGYSGEIYEKDKNYYRIFEDKNIIAILE